VRTIRSILGLTVGFVIVSSILAAAVAAVAKRHMISSGTETDDEFDLVTIFDGVDFASTAPAFRRGSVLTWYGGGQIDLRGATLDPAGAKLNVRALFGGVQIIVPETWRVEQRMVAFLGGVGDSRDSAETQGTGPLLVLDGWAVFGGIDVTSEPQQAESDAEAPAPATA
jgi:Cell wall-active antibiotics response 4TMS YvqF